MFSTSRLFTCSKTTTRIFTINKSSRQFTTFTSFKMPEQLKQEELHKDITVAKQYDSETPSEKKFEDMYAIADKLKIAMMGSFRNGIGVGRSHCLKLVSS